MLRSARCQCIQTPSTPLTQCPWKRRHFAFPVPCLLLSLDVPFVWDIRRACGLKGRKPQHCDLLFVSARVSRLLIYPPLINHYESKICCLIWLFSRGICELCEFLPPRPICCAARGRLRAHCHSVFHGSDPALPAKTVATPT
jgi:hypothetical protein